MGDSDPASRRRFVQATGAAVLAGLAGCLDEAEIPTARAADWCFEELEGPVSSQYETAESIDGISRDPDDLVDKPGSAYQCFPQGYQLCANCRYFIPSQSGQKEAGACVRVEGWIRSQDWCALYAETDRLEQRPAAEADGPPL